MCERESHKRTLVGWKWLAVIQFTLDRFNITAALYPLFHFYWPTHSTRCCYQFFTFCCTQVALEWSSVRVFLPFACNQHSTNSSLSFRHHPTLCKSGSLQLRQVSLKILHSLLSCQIIAESNRKKMMEYYTTQLCSRTPRDDWK